MGAPGAPRGPASIRRSWSDLDFLAIAERAGRVDDALVVAQAGADRDAIAHRLADGDPAQLGAATRRDEHAGEVAALHEGALREPGAGGLAGAGDEEAREGATLQLARTRRDARAQAAAVRQWVAARCERRD